MKRIVGRRVVQATTLEPITVEDRGLTLYEIKINDRDATLKCALILLQEFMQEMRPPDTLKRILRDTRVKARSINVPNSDKVITEIEKMAVQERYKNAKNFVMDSLYS